MGDYEDHVKRATQIYEYTTLAAAKRDYNKVIKNGFKAKITKKACGTKYILTSHMGLMTKSHYKRYRAKEKLRSNPIAKPTRQRGAIERFFFG